MVENIDERVECPVIKKIKFINSQVKEF